MAQQGVLVEAGCTQAEVLEITVVSGFVPAATSGSILPWALSTESLILPGFFSECFSGMKNIFKHQEDHLLPLPKKLHLNKFFFFRTLFLLEMFILKFFSERF